MREKEVLFDAYPRSFLRIGKSESKEIGIMIISKYLREDGSFLAIVTNIDWKNKRLPVKKLFISAL